MSSSHALWGLFFPSTELRTPHRGKEVGWSGGGSPDNQMGSEQPFGSQGLSLVLEPAVYPMLVLEAPWPPLLSGHDRDRSPGPLAAPGYSSH